MVAPRGWSATRAIPLLLVLAAIIGIVLVFVRTPTEPVIATRVTVSGGAAPATEDLGAAEASEPEHTLHDAATITAASQHEQQGQEEEEDRSPADASVLGGLVGVRHRNPFDTAVAITSHDGHAKALNELTLSYLDSAQALPPSEHPIPPHLTPEPVHAAMQRWFPGCRYSLLPQEPPEPPVAIEVRPVLHVFLRVPKWVSLSWTHCDTRRAVVVPEPLPPAELVLTSVWLTYLSCPPASAGQPNTTADFEWSFCLPLPSARDGPKARPWSVVYCREAQYSTGLQMRRSSFDFDATFSSTEKVPEFPVDWVPVPSFIFQVPPLAFDTKLNQSLIVHLASNCVEEREGFVDAMQRYGLSVDRFGTCSTIDTPPPHAMRPLPSHRDSRSQWKEELYHVYRFCTAMENARSPNYISEKVWEALRVGCIPLYWGDSTLLKRQVPPRSVIFIDDFAANHTALFEHIKALGADRELYESYHAWRYNPPKAFLDFLNSNGFGLMMKNRGCLWQAKSYELREDIDHDEQSAHSTS